MIHTRGLIKMNVPLKSPTRTILFVCNDDDRHNDINTTSNLENGNMCPLWNCCVRKFSIVIHNSTVQLATNKNKALFCFPYMRGLDRGGI